jgi:NTE family protein
MSDDRTPPDKSVALVLGSGGARGLAHIGVIRWLIENGYEIRSITGASMGALIGGIFASGKLDVYAKWVMALERMQVLRLLDPSFNGSGLFKGDRIIGVLRELIGESAIEELPIAFSAVATDLESGEEVWLNKGKLFDAIRASMATPLIFTPFHQGKRTLLDGALVNPLPLSPGHAEGTALTIAVNLGGRPRKPSPAPAPAHEPEPEPESEAAPATNGNAYRQRVRAFVESLGRSRTPVEPSPGLFDIAFTSMQTMQDALARLKLASCPPDVTVEVPRNACGYFEFWRAEELIELGHERAAKAFARWQARAAGPAEGKTQRPVGQ